MAYEDAVKHIVLENGIDPNDERNIHEMMRIPKTETHLKRFRCLFCDGGKLFVGMSEESFLEHVNRQHSSNCAQKKPHKLKRECRICSQCFEADLALTRHIKKEHIDNGSSNQYPFGGFGPKEDAEEEDLAVVVVEADSSNKRRKVSRMRSPSASESSSEEEVIRRGIEKAQRKRQRLELELERQRQEPEPRRTADPGLERGSIKPETFFFVCSICGRKDVDQFKIYEHLDTEHGLGEEESVLAKRTFRPRAVLECRYCSHYHLTALNAPLAILTLQRTE